MRMRVFSGRTPRSGATELTGATQIGTTVAAALSTTADQTSVVTGVRHDHRLNNEYLFFVLAWEITTAGGTNAADVVSAPASPRRLAARHADFSAEQHAAGRGRDRVHGRDHPASALRDLVVIDGFDRADGPVDAGAGASIWVNARFDTGAASDLRVVSNRVGAVSGSAQYAYLNRSFFELAADFDLLFDVITPPATAVQVYFAMRQEGTAAHSGYFLALISGGQWQLARVEGQGGGGVLATGTRSVSAADTIWVSKRGGRLTAYHRPVGTSGFIEVLTADDPSYIAAPGIIAIQTSDPVMRLDNLFAGPLVGGTRTRGARRRRVHRSGDAGQDHPRPRPSGDDGSGDLARRLANRAWPTSRPHLLAEPQGGGPSTAISAYTAAPPKVRTNMLAGQARRPFLLRRGRARVFPSGLATEWTLVYVSRRLARRGPRIAASSRTTPTCSSATTACPRT